MTAVEILIGGRAYLDEHGWAQHVFETDDGEVCVARAVTRSAELGEGGRSRAYNSLLAAGHQRWGVRSSRIAEYNDKYCKTKEEALAWFDDAIKMAA